MKAGDQRSYPLHQNFRVVEKSLLYVIGFPKGFLDIDKSTLKSKKFFGMYGQVISVVPTL